MQTFKWLCPSAPFKVFRVQHKPPASFQHFQNATVWGWPCDQHKNGIPPPPPPPPPKKKSSYGPANIRQKGTFKTMFCVKPCQNKVI